MPELNMRERERERGYEAYTSVLSFMTSLTLYFNTLYVSSYTERERERERERDR